MELFRPGAHVRQAKIYTHGNKLGNTCNNVTTNFGLYISFFVNIMKNVLTICQNLQSP